MHVSDMKNTLRRNRVSPGNAGERNAVAPGFGKQVDVRAVTPTARRPLPAALPSLGLSWRAEDA